MQTIDAIELKRCLDAGEDLVLLHVLPRVSFDKSRLPGAMHASFYDDGFVERAEAFASSEETRLVVYCGSQHCNAATRAAEALREAGTANVVLFTGGIEEWQAAGFPTAGTGR